jgi:type I restriction enzyme, S subunit
VSDCKITGQHPSEWQMVKLGDISSFIRGVTFDAAEAKSTESAGYLPVLRAGNIQDELSLDEDLVWVPQSRISPYQMITAGDVVICMSSGSRAVVGKTAQSKVDWQGSVGAFCGLLRPGPAIDPRFFGLWLRSGAFTKWRLSVARGANIQNLRFSEMAGIEIPLPPLAEQRRIVVILNEQLAAVEKARAAAEAQLEAAKSLPGAYLREVFPQGEPSKAPLPPGWQWARLSDICDFRHGGTPSKAIDAYWKGTIPWISPKDMKCARLKDAIDHISQEAVACSTTGMAATDSLLMVVRSGILARTLPCGIAMRDLAFNQDIKALIPHHGALSSMYLLLLMRDREASILAEGVKIGATVHSMKSGYIENLRIPLPPLPEQERIATALDERMAAVDSLRSGLESQLAQINALPAAMLRQAFSGEL